MGWKAIADAMKCNAGSQRGPQHGSTTTGGRATMEPNPPGIKINSLKQAIWIRSLLQPSGPASLSPPEWRQIVTSRGAFDQTQLPESEATILEENLPGSHKSLIELKSKYPGQRIETAMRKASTGAQMTKSSPSLTEQSLADYHRRPAHTDTLLAHLMRLSAHKPIKGTDKSSPEEGSTQTTHLLADFATRLSDLHVTELAIYFVVDHFIANDDDPFFPSFAKLKKAVA